MPGSADTELQAVEDHERAVLENRVVRFRKGRTRQDLTGRIAVIVDDGIATGSTARVACRVARQLGAARVILAVPVAPADTLGSLTEPDEVVCLATPHQFSAVGYHYRDFSPTEDDEVVQLLDAAAKRLRNSQPASAEAGHGRRGGPRGGRRGSRDPVARGPAPGPAALAGPCPGRRAVRARQRQQPPQPPEPVRGRGAPAGRARHAAAGPADPGGGTRPRQRLRHRTAGPPAVLGHGLARRPAGHGLLHLGYFGASTGAGAALWAASEPTARIDAVVSRGGRPDLAGPRLPPSRAPTLLIVGSYDHEVLELNRKAKSMMRCPNQLAVVQGATHLFEEPGTLAAAAILARDWFVDYLLPADTGPERSPSDPVRPCGGRRRGGGRRRPAGPRRRAAGAPGRKIRWR